MMMRKAGERAEVDKWTGRGSREGEGGGGRRGGGADGSNGGTRGLFLFDCWYKVLRYFLHVSTTTAPPPRTGSPINGWPAGAETAQNLFQSHRIERIHSWRKYLKK